MTSPYSDLPPRNFWKSAVAEPTGDIDLYVPKFPITRATPIAAAGSCFAQHIARHLRKIEANLLDVEPPPGNLPDDIVEAYSYRQYSARFGNIYVVRQLLQLLDESAGARQPQNWIWQREDGLHVDGLRPTIDPEGFDDIDELTAHRTYHLKAVARLFRQTKLLIFTFGLTESWIDQTDGTVYPTAPGVVAQPPSAARLTFHNMSFTDTMNDFLEVRAKIHALNPECRFLLTVSPVPLTATVRPAHVLLASTQSKATLRAVAGELTQAYDDIDYFPSFELISSHVSGQKYFEANLRTVNRSGVSAAMQMFMEAHGANFDAVPDPLARRREFRRLRAELAAERAEEVRCEDELLEAFRK
jgi:hypothetical protein